MSFLVVVFFLSSIDVWSLLSSPLSARKTQLSSAVKCWSQRTGVSDGIETVHNKTDDVNRRYSSDNFPIAKTTKIKIKDTNCDEPQDFGLKENIDNDPKTIKDNGDNDNADWKRCNNNTHFFCSLEKVTQDLLDFNQIDAGSWTQQDCDKVVNVINLWSKRSGGPGRLQPAFQQERLLRRVIEEKHAVNEFALDLNMTDIYHQIIFSWSKSHETGSANRAEEILDAMQHAYSSGQDRDLQPSIDAWNSAIGSHAQSKSKDAAENAMRVFNKLHYFISEGQTDVRPNDDSYAHILKAIASSGEPDAPKKVLDLLIRMQNLSQNGFSIDVTSSCHNVYLSSLVESMKNSKVSATETARLAESHLRKMKENPNPNSQPDRRSKLFLKD